MRLNSRFLAIFCLFAALIYSAAKAPLAHARKKPTPKQALLYWEIYANPDILNPNEMSELYNAGAGSSVRKIPVPNVKDVPCLLVPRAEVRWLETGLLPEEVLELMTPVWMNGTEYLRFPLSPYDKNSNYAELERDKFENLSFDRTASRGFMIKNAQFDTQGASDDDLYLQIKASTEVTHGRNPDKRFSKKLAELNALVHRLIGNKKFKHLIVLPEPLFLTVDRLDLGVSFRQWKSVLSGFPRRYVMPMFTATRNKEGYLLALINGYLNPTDFAVRHIAYPAGLGDREYGEETGIMKYAPHGQNRLLLFDEDLRPLDMPVDRDVGDTRTIVLDIAKRHYSSDVIAGIRQQRPRLLQEGPYSFRFPNILYENGWTDEQAAKRWYEAYKAGLNAYSPDEDAHFEMAMSLSGYYDFQKKPGLKPQAPQWVKPVHVTGNLAPLWSNIRDLFVYDIFGQAPTADQIQSILAQAEPFMEQLRAAKSASDELVAESLAHLGSQDLELLKSRFVRTHSPQLRQKILEILGLKINDDPEILKFLLQHGYRSMPREIVQFIRNTIFTNQTCLAEILRFAVNEKFGSNFTKTNIYKDVISKTRQWSEENQDLIWELYSQMGLYEVFIKNTVAQQMRAYPRLQQRLNESSANCSGLVEP